MAFAHQIAQGMAHLESKGVVHGYLATYVSFVVCACLYVMKVGLVLSCRRCVIVCKKGTVCKVADVGRLQVELEGGLGTSVLYVDVIVSKLTVCLCVFLQGWRPLQAIAWPGQHLKLHHSTNSQQRLMCVRMGCCSVSY
jgi:hypothetical protein